MPRLFGQGDIGEVSRPSPAADGNQGLDMRVVAFQYLQLMKTPAQAVRIPGIAGIPFVYIGIGIAEDNGSGAVADIGEGVIDVGNMFRGDVRDMIVPAVNRPGSKIADDFLFRRLGKGAEAE